ncbi:MAG: FAD-dependent oxidoreductase [Promethearchaeota archaeon]
MKILIIGNGIAGTLSAQNIRNLNKNVEIEVYSQEKYPYYSRIKLPQLISEKITIEDLIVFKKEWYKSKNIKTYLNKKIIGIDPKNKQVLIEGKEEQISYDKLVLATGSTPNIPPIKNAQEMIGKGVFTLRNIDNAIEIRNYIKKKKVKKVIIIGGGLLGLELAKQIKDCDLETTVIEFFPRLLPRQLDNDCSNLLKEKIENMGINVELNVATEEIIVNGIVKGIKTKNNRIIESDLVLIQAGIKATIELAKKAKIKTNRGIIVNQFLETSVKDIYAVGDCIEYKNQMWGIIPACLEQSKILSTSIFGKKDVKYNGTIPKNTLKVVGIDLTSIGIYDIDDKDLIGAGWEILKNLDKKEGCYKKIVLKENKLKGAILLGEKKAINYINKNIGKDIDKLELREAINLYEWICSGCNRVYDEAKMELLFKYLPDDWKCPNCKTPKNKFKKLLIDKN